MQGIGSVKVHGNAWRGGFVSNIFVFIDCIEWELCIKRRGSEGSKGSEGSEGVVAAVAAV